MSIINNKETKAMISESLMALSRTHTITEEDAGLPEWDMLKAEYANPLAETAIEKACVSIINACLTQRRVVFAMSRTTARELIRSDKNWPKSVGLKNDKWSSLLKEMYDKKLIVREQEADGRRPGMFKLIHPAILKFLSVNEAEQRQQVIDFINNIPENTEGTTKGDHKRGQSIRISNQEEDEYQNKNYSASVEEESFSEDREQQEMERLRKLALPHQDPVDLEFCFNHFDSLSYKLQQALTQLYPDRFASLTVKEA